LANGYTQVGQGNVTTPPPTMNILSNHTKRNMRCRQLLLLPGTSGNLYHVFVLRIHLSGSSLDQSKQTLH
jgi:hypothetical protein